MGIPNDTCQNPKPHSKSKVLVPYLLLKTNRHFLSNISIPCFLPYCTYSLKASQLNIYTFKEKPEKIKNLKKIFYTISRKSLVCTLYSLYPNKY